MAVVEHARPPAGRRWPQGAPPADADVRSRVRGPLRLAGPSIASAPTDGDGTSHHDGEIAFATAVVTRRREGNRLHHDGHAHEYCQTSLLSASMSGVYDGEPTVGTLLGHGDFGVGSFNALDGETIVLDGIACRLTGDGSAAVAADEDRTPYAAAVPFEADVEERIDGPLDRKALESRLDGLAGSRNRFYAVRVDGRFARMKVRNMVRQEPPCRPLLGMVAGRMVHTLESVDGTMVGFRCPDYAVGIGVPGSHLPFVDAPRGRSDHVLDDRLESGRFRLDLPETGAFAAADLTAGSSAEAIRKVES